MKIPQAQKILAVLTDRRGEWVPMPDLASASGSYNVATRVSVDLRAEGWPVENKVEIFDGVKHSFYRLPCREEVIELKAKQAQEEDRQAQVWERIYRQEAFNP